MSLLVSGNHCPLRIGGLGFHVSVWTPMYRNCACARSFGSHSTSPFWISERLSSCSSSTRRYLDGNIRDIKKERNLIIIWKLVPQQINHYRQTQFWFNQWSSILQECIPVGCVPSAAVAVCWGGGVCHSACWDTPPEPGSWHPLDRPPWAWA